MAKKLIKDLSGNYYCDPKTHQPIVVDVGNDSDAIINYLGRQYSGKAIDTYGDVAGVPAFAFTGQNITEASFPNASIVGQNYVVTYAGMNKTISGPAFADCTQLSKISFPECEKFEFSHNFYNCIELESAIFPNFESDTIQAYTFYNCIKLSAAEFPTATVVSAYAFYNCSNLKTFSTQAGLSLIGSFAFSGCVSLESVKFASSDITLSSYAFCSCGLKGISIVCDNVYSMWTHCFAYCSQLNTVYIKAHSSISINGGNVFYNCTSLKEITLLQDSGVLVNAGGSTFAYCTSLESVNLFAPDGIELKSNGMFYNCTNLKWGNLSNANITLLSGATIFGNCTNLSYVYAPVISYISGTVFLGCTNLSYIYAPVVSYISASKVFANCENLASIYIMQKSGLTEANVPELGHSAIFSGIRYVGTSTPDGHPWIYVGYPEYVPWLQNATNWAIYSSWIVASQFVPQTE